MFNRYKLNVLLAKFLNSFILQSPPKFRRFLFLLIDLCLIIISFLIILWISQNDLILIKNLFPIFSSSVLIGIPLFLITGQYKSLSRYVGSLDLYKIALRNLFLVITLFFICGFYDLKFLPISFWFLLWFFLSSFTGITRFILRDILINFPIQVTKKIPKIAIFGAGESGALLASAIKVSKNYQVEFFIDDAPHLWGRNINNIKIYSRDYLKKGFRKIDKLILSIPSLDKVRRRRIFKYLKSFDIEVLQSPSIEALTRGQENIDNLKPIKIEDLLGREPVEPYKKLLGPGIASKVVLVTGAGGSIGSELCKTIIKLKPKLLILIEQNEFNLYKLEKELLKDSSYENNLLAILGSCLDRELVKNIFVNYKVDTIFHSAAYKHVPLVEENPLAGIRNNVFSTKILCEMMKTHNAKNFVLISTDKAVRPTSVMGASKRLSELIVQAYAQEASKETNNKKKFSCVRFGNVLGSSGSVVPLFEEQILSGGPITLTHPDIIRYFMSIKEAAQLVIQSSVLAEGGDVFILDMGQPVKIKDLAEQMINLSGLQIKNKDNPNGDIEIKSTGLRKGEKLFEELLIDDKALKTSHSLIFKANEKFIQPEILWQKLSLLNNSLEIMDIEESKRILKNLVPEWRSEF